MDDFSSQVGDWLLEDSLSGSKHINATAARAIVTPNPHVVVCVINPTDTPVTIYRGTHVASIFQLPHVNLCGVSQSTTMSQKKKVLWGIASNVTTLSDTEQEQFYALLTSFADIFPINKDDLGRTRLLQHSIDTWSAPPIKQPPRCIPQHKQQEAQRLLQEKLNKNIFSRSHNPWSSPIILVQKKDGSLRFCIDYRKINEVTRKDAYPLSRIDETLDTLSGSSWFITLADIAHLLDSFIYMYVLVV